MVSKARKISYKQRLLPILGTAKGLPTDQSRGSWCFTEIQPLLGSTESNADAVEATVI
jgi:hypothetical protein